MELVHAPSRLDRQSRRMSRPSWRFAALIIVGAVYLVLSIALGIVLGEAALHPPRRALRPDAEARARLRVEQVGGHLDPVTLTTNDGVTLRAWLFSPASDAWNGHAVLSLHGVADNRESGVSMATLLVSHGYRVLTPDARASGVSGGAFATYGVLERDDIREWVAWLRARQPAGCIHGLGGSMGAAQLLQTIADPTLFCDAVAESSFESFREVAFDRVGQRLGTGPWLGRTLLRPAIEVGFLSARLRTGLDLSGANPARTLRDSTTPVLLIHGLADRNMPVRHAEALAAAGHLGHVTLWLVPGATHVAAWAAAPVEYPARVLAFFAAHEQDPPSAAAASGPGNSEHRPSIR
jgi:dipeptidyl aminopeptidase/acylaminoacyl peptidase